MADHHNITTSTRHASGSVAGVFTYEQYMLSQMKAKQRKQTSHHPPPFMMFESYAIAQEEDEPEVPEEDYHDEHDPDDDLYPAAASGSYSPHQPSIPENHVGFAPHPPSHAPPRAPSNAPPSANISRSSSPKEAGGGKVQVQEMSDDDFKDYYKRSGVPDGEYGWVIVAAAFFSGFTVFGTQYSFGVLFQGIHKEFPRDSTMISLVGSLALGIFFFSGAPVGRMIEIFGCRSVAILGAFISGFALLASAYVKEVYQLLFTYGIAAAIGLQMGYGPGLIMIGQYFNKKRSFATMIAVAGSGVGTFVMSVISAAFQEASGLSWRIYLLYFQTPFTFLMLLAIGISYVPLVDTLRRKSSVVKGGPSFKLTKFFDYPFLKSNPYAKFLCLSRAIASFGYYAPSVHIVAYASSKHHFDSTRLSLISPMFGVGSLIGRLVFAKISQGPILRRFIIYALTLTVSGVVTILLGVANWYYVGPRDGIWAVFIVYQFMYGVFAGAAFALLPIVAADLCGVQNLTRALGLAYTSQTIFVIAGPAFLGIIADVDIVPSHGYDFGFIIMGVALIVAIVPLMFVPNIMKDAEKLIDQTKTKTGKKMITQQAVLSTHVTPRISTPKHGNKAEL